MVARIVRWARCGNAGKLVNGKRVNFYTAVSSYVVRIRRRRTRARTTANSYYNSNTGKDPNTINNSYSITCGCLRDGDFVVVTYVVLGPTQMPESGGCMSLPRISLAVTFPHDASPPSDF